MQGCSPSPDPRRTDFTVVHPGLTAVYDDTTGRLKRIEMDQNKNGVMDTFSHWDGNLAKRIDLDLDEDGAFEKREYYGANNKLEKVGIASRRDGVEDSWNHFDETGRLTMVEADEDRDGRVDRRYFYGPHPDRPDDRIMLSAENEFDSSGRPRFRVHFRPDGSHMKTETLR